MFGYEFNSNGTAISHSLLLSHNRFLCTSIDADAFKTSFLIR
jgi:hypothetical protein